MGMKVGIICDLDYTRHPCFKNYFYAIEYLYGSIKLVKSPDDLVGLDILFIGDDHYYFHKLVWLNHEFVKSCNDNEISVVVFTTEKILNSCFPWNMENYNRLQDIKKLHHYTIDVDDCEAFGTKLNRVLISKHYRDKVWISKVDDYKTDKIVFIGSTTCFSGSYDKRIETLGKIAEAIPMETIPSTIDSWTEYLQVIGKYRFVLSPLGNANAFPMRFYETLLVGSIPVHQIKDNTLNYYDIEAQFDDCIYFKEPEELPDKINGCTLLRSNREFWMEDYLEKILKEDGLL